jgi:hypothetical protein
VRELRKFRDEAGGDEIWFPVHGLVQKNWFPETNELEVVELKVNRAIDPGRFSIPEPDLPDGVLVNFRGHQESYTGGRRDLWDERQRLLDVENERILPMLGTQQPARADQFEGLPIVALAVKLYYEVHWSTWLLIALSLTLAVGGGISVLRAKLRRGA